MIVTVVHRIEVDSIQKATACREKMTEYLDADSEVTVIRSDQAQDENPYEVAGVDTQTNKPFSQQVEAADEEAAKEKVQTDRKVVATVTPAGP